MLCISWSVVVLQCAMHKKDKNSTHKPWKKHRLRSLPCKHCQVCTSILIRIKPPNLSVNILTKIHFQNSTKLNLKILIKIQLQNLCQTWANQLPRQFYQLEVRPPGGVVAFVNSICNAIIISNNMTRLIELAPPSGINSHQSSFLKIGDSEWVSLVSRADKNRSWVRLV